MCNLYSVTSNVEAMRRVFNVHHDQLGNMPRQSAIFPGHDAPAVRLDDQGQRELIITNWGFILPQRGKAPNRVTNARQDKVRESRFWKSSFEERRCLVPVSSFSEPKGRQPAIWYWFGMKGDEPRSLFAFAGIWRHWAGELKGELVDLTVMAFLTTNPNAVVRPIHPRRMPVILHPDDYETWLIGTPDQAIKLAKPYPAEAMQIVHKGEKKDDPAMAA